MAVPLPQVTVQLDTIEIIGPAIVGFLARPPSSSPILNAQVGRIIGNAKSLIRIDEHIYLFWGTRVGYVDLLRIKTNILVRHLGKIDLPKTVIIDKGWSLDVCGTISSNINELIVREDGALKMSHPASDLQINTLVIDYRGRLESTSYCSSKSEKVTLQVTYFNTTDEFVLDEDKFVLSASFQGNVSAAGVMGNETQCHSNGSITLERDTYCTLPPGIYWYESITVGPGAEIRLDGMNSTTENGSETTVIYAENMYLKFDSLMTGVGTGFQTKGPAAAGSVGTGATHAGRGVGNTKNTYGSVTSPMNYGSNGYSAVMARGGGQIKIVVADNLRIEGSIDMSADSGAGGSGGSIFLQAREITGDGYLKVEGKNGGGGGRIAAVATHSYTFTGTASAVGGEDSSGKKGSAGENSVSFPLSFKYFSFHCNLIRNVVSDCG